MGVKPKIHHRRYWALFLVVGALLSFVAYYSIRQVNRLVIEEQAAAETKMQTRSVLVDMIDAEDGLRGYLLTGHREFLGPYHQGVGRLSVDLAQMKARNPPTDQSKVVESLTKKLVDEWIAQIDLSENEGIEAARKRFLDNPTKPAMDALRDSVAVVRAAETRDLDSLRQSLRSEIDTASSLLTTSFIGGLAISIALATSLLSPPGCSEEEDE